MPMFKITNGTDVRVIDAASKSAANSYAHAHLDIKIEPASSADLVGVDLASMPVVLKGGKTQAEIDAEAQAEAAKKAAAEAKKAQPAATV